MEIALLRRVGSADRVVQRRVITLAQGPFSRVLRLARTLLPGALQVRLREVGPVTGARLTDAVGSVRLKPPPEGVVSRAFVSALQRGPATRSLRGGRRIFAHFLFAARPRASLPLRAAWSRNGRPAGVVVRKAFARTVIAFIGSPGGRLPDGLYRCELRAGRRVVATATIRLL